MIRRILTTALAAGVVAAVACSDAPTTAPLQRASGAGAAHRKHDNGPGNANSHQAALVRCENHPAFVGEGEIGANGGQIIIGDGGRLIIPPGALTKNVWIRATIPAGENVTIDFEFSPHGVAFKKPLGLVLNAAGCDIAGYSAPSIAYYNEETGELGEYIQSYYSNHWHVVAAPIWHFSGYAVAF
jgi:hypothetical protein